MSKIGKVVIVAALVVAVAAVIYVKQAAPGKTLAPADAAAPGVAAPPKVAPAAALPRLVDLGAKTCIPCKMMAPILEGLKAEYAGRLQVDFIDVKETPAASQAYGITLIPTQIFYDAAGQERFRHEGFFSKEDILAKWKELGVDLPASAAPTVGAGGQ
jgi:thioredoxin 1